MKLRHRTCGQKPTYYTAPIGIGVPSREQIEVTDPTHPLYGLALPCLGVTTRPRLGHVCLVWLAPGVERLIPLAATSLAPLPPPPVRCRLSVPAVHALLAVLGSCRLDDSADPGQEGTDGSTQSSTLAPRTARAPAGISASGRDNLAVGPGAAASPPLGQPHPSTAPGVSADPRTDPPGGGQ